MGETCKNQSGDAAGTNSWCEIKGKCEHAKVGEAESKGIGANGVSPQRLDGDKRIRKQGERFISRRQMENQ